jgi:hypothetical protein
MLPRLRQAILRYGWYVHVPLTLMLRIAPGAALQTMATAARPSTDRLHLRNLFADGRRYHIEPSRDGFRMKTTSKMAFRYRRRTASTTVLSGVFSPLGDDLTRLQLQVRIRVGYLLDAFLLPTFMASIIIFMPWHPLLIALPILLLYWFSWFGHRYNAKLEAHAMTWFIQKTLEDHITTEVAILPDRNPEVIDIRQDFETEWEKFMQQMR